MFVYGLAKGVNEGWLSPIFAPAAITGWNGLATRVLADGRIDGICEGTTYANDSTYYYYRGASANTTFGGSVLYAGMAVVLGAALWGWKKNFLQMLQNPKLKLSAPQPGSVNSALHGRWTDDLPKIKG